jgi:hypothetical protein
MRPEEMDIIDRQVAITTNLMVRVAALEKALLGSGILDQEKHQQIIAEMEGELLNTVKTVIDEFKDKLQNPEQLSLDLGKQE